jgi:hypothetical protein
VADESKNDEGAAVGYGRPPVATRFKKGQSGNPAGRPRKAKGLRAVAERVLGAVQRLAGQPKGARVLYTVLEVVVMTLKQRAASGDPKAGAVYTDYVDRFGRQEHAHRDVGYLVVPEVLSEEEWEARYSPKDDPPDEEESVD